MLNRQIGHSAFSYGDFVWWFGVVEDRNDPMMIGRVRVRVLGYHTDDKDDIPTEDLYWAYPILPVNATSTNGIGISATGIVEGTWVFGFFRDGITAQDPMILGTLGGIPDEKPNAKKGFYDPNERYPEEKYLKEPDTNRLSRNQNIEKTTIQWQRDNEVHKPAKQGESDSEIRKAPDIEIPDTDPPRKITRGSAVPKSLGDGEWEELTTAYAAKYPYNHVRETESGHQEEWDDTPGAERYRRWHKAGSFIEVHPDGSEVHKVVRDKYEITMGDEYVYISGNVTVTIQGNANILTEGNVRMQTKGNFDHYVEGNYQLLVGGNMKTRSQNRMYFDAKRIDLNMPGPAINF